MAEDNVIGLKLILYQVHAPFVIGIVAETSQDPVYGNTMQLLAVGAGTEPIAFVGVGVTAAGQLVMYTLEDGAGEGALGFKFGVGGSGITVTVFEGAGAEMGVGVGDTNADHDVVGTPEIITLEYGEMGDPAGEGVLPIVMVGEDTVKVGTEVGTEIPVPATRGFMLQVWEWAGGMKLIKSNNNNIMRSIFI